MGTTELPVVCDLSALSSEQRQRLDVLLSTRIVSPDEVRELPDGYGLGFHDPSGEVLADLAEFISLDRRCCAFARYALISEPGSGRAWLEVTGPPGAGEAIAGEILARANLETPPAG
ncbi:hypothetical protein [Nitriliruptor alkaliphilus]|uniref:hypothetical protein n=1 Tax=Nitriliruptor alkaliphilus TaxID=427918 RepID=UPI0006972B3F|nr:hypothetical protein [Nitriliruptor alkaliphilus]